MKRAVLTVALAATLIASVIVAHAATLHVDAGILQTQSIVTDIDIPDDPAISYVINVTARRFSSGRNPSQVGAVSASATLSAGQSYVVAWSGGGVVPCADVNFDPSTADQAEQGPGTFVAAADEGFTFCSQTGSGTLTITPIAGGTSGMQDGAQG